MTNTDITRENKPESLNPKQASRPVSGIARSGLNMRVPYLIATVFIALTALLTLLLNAAMDNKTELQQNIALRNSNPLLVDARSAFGQVTAIDNFHSSSATEVNADQPPLINESVAHTGIANNDANTGSRPDRGTNVNVLPVLDSGIAITPENDDITATVKLTSDKPQQSPSTLVPISEQVTIATDVNSSALDRIVETHLDKIDYIWGSLSRQTHNQQELESTVLQYMALMDEQINELTRRVNAVEEIQRVGTAFERVLHKRQGSFERILNRRFNILQRANQSRTLLRAGYTELLDEVHTRHRPDLA